MRLKFIQLNRLLYVQLITFDNIESDLLLISFASISFVLILEFTLVVILHRIAFLLLSVILLHLFEAFSVCCTYELGLHVVDFSLRVHQVLLLFALNLDHSHDDAVYHVHRLSFTIFAFFLPVRILCLDLIFIEVLLLAFFSVELLLVSI